MAQETSHQTRWELLTARVGDADATLNSALVAALTIFNSGGYQVWSSGGWWVMPDA
jgi:hypothetical protein